MSSINLAKDQKLIYHSNHSCCKGNTKLELTTVIVANKKSSDGYSDCEWKRVSTALTCDGDVCHRPSGPLNASQRQQFKVKVHSGERYPSQEDARNTLHKMKIHLRTKCPFCSGKN